MHATRGEKPSYPHVNLVSYSNDGPGNSGMDVVDVTSPI